ncbi:MAG: energy-coupling factor transporter transmembrane component T [Anaerotignum sp.]|nr:energy-coupling factor transporter transmembrane component T [Anaerotignum sp.]
MIKYKKLSIDPRIKILFCILINIVIYSYTDKLYLILFVGYALVLLFLEKEYQSIKTFAFIYLLIFMFRILNPYIPQLFVRIITPTIVSIQMFFPFIIYGALLIKTSKISDVANVLDKMHFPDEGLIPFLVLFRFFPTIKEEAGAISDAMKLRGLNYGLGSLIKKPVKTIEYLYVPLLYSMVKAFFFPVNQDVENLLY